MGDIIGQPWNQCSRGYDVQTPAGTTNPSMLSSRRELVEQLDSEPLFDYLIQNGVLEPFVVDQIKNEKSAAKVNIALLRHLESSGKSALNLFINALRQTGQHHLASLLDDSQRIKALSGSGYLSKKRHKGQVTLQIEVKALRLVTDIVEKGGPQNGKFPRSATFTINREWITLDDLAARIHHLQNPPPSGVPAIEAADAEENGSQKKRSCLCLCLSRMFRKKEHSKAAKYAPAANPPNGYKTQNMLEAQRLQSDPNTSVTKEDEIENLKNLADTFKQKANIFYSILRDPESESAQTLVKYFEQERGVLVLDTDCQQGFMIINICMRVEQLEQLRKDYSMGKLAKDIESNVITDDVLAKVGAKGMKLHTIIDQDEFEIAEQELR